MSCRMFGYYERCFVLPAYVKTACFMQFKRNTGNLLPIAHIPYTVEHNHRITSYNVCYTKLLRSQVNFDWTGDGLEVPGVPGHDAFSVRWTGELESSFTGPVRLFLTVDDSGSLVFDGQRIVITSYSIHYTKLYDLDAEKAPQVCLGHGAFAGELSQKGLSLPGSRGRGGGKGFVVKPDSLGKLFPGRRGRGGPQTRGTDQKRDGQERRGAEGFRSMHGEPPKCFVNSPRCRSGRTGVQGGD